MRLTPIPEHLIKALEARFPPMLPTPHNTLAEVMFAAGQRDVVRLLRQEFNDQTSRNT